MTALPSSFSRFSAILFQANLFLDAQTTRFVASHKWTVMKLLGQGVCGIVLAIITEAGEPFALKISDFKIYDNNEPARLYAMQREVKVVQKIIELQKDHDTPGVAHFYEAGFIPAQDASEKPKSFIRLEM